jgi:hypothetical protein
MTTSRNSADTPMSEGGSDGFGWPIATVGIPVNVATVDFADDTHRPKETRALGVVRRVG